MTDMRRRSSVLSMDQASRLPKRTMLRWITLFSVVTIGLAYLFTHPVLEAFLPSRAPTGIRERIVLPKMLDQKCLARFDRLVEQGHLYWNESKTEFYDDHGFFFEFRIVPNQGAKPILALNDPARTQKSKGPFLNPDPREIITNISTHHRLMLNKYSIYRPMLVIPTTEFALQTDDLDAADINAGWTVLRHFPSFILTYNCGPNSGSSQGHKHMQGIPHPRYQLWPHTAVSTTDVAERLARVPFAHYVLRLPPAASAAHVLAAYRHLLDLYRAQLDEEYGRLDYNVAVTRDWIAVIPRRRTDRMYGANTAGMLGLVSVPDQNSRDLWERFGYSQYLVELGVPLPKIVEQD